MKVKSMNWSRRCLLGIMAASFFAGISAPVRADSDETLTIIVPLGSGGALDKMSRHMAEHLPSAGNFQVKVENRVIKGDSNGYRDFLERPADGLTVLAWFEPAAAYYGEGFSYDDLSIINLQEIEPPILAARADLGWSSMEDFVNEARLNPGKIRIGAGKAGGNLLLMKRQFEALGIEITEVDYASGGKARTGLLNSEIELTVGSLKAIKKLGDEAVPLAVMSPRRLRLWREVPNIATAIKFTDAEPIFGASYRFFAVRREVREERPAAFRRLADAMRATTETNDAFLQRYGGHSRWFGPEESAALLRRANAHFLDLRDRKIIPATQPAN